MIGNLAKLKLCIWGGVSTKLNYSIEHSQHKDHCLDPWYQVLKQLKHDNQRRTML